MATTKELDERVIVLELAMDSAIDRLDELEKMISELKNPNYPEPEANVKVKLVGGIMPKKANIDKGDGREDSGWDIYSTERFSIEAGKVCTIDAKIQLNIPEGYEGQVRPKSGLSSKGILAAWGTVDNPYTGNLGITLYNTTNTIWVCNAGDKIAQLVIAKLAKITFEIMGDDESLPLTDRGDKGFGSNTTNN